jgi:hypothetical protein
MDSILGKVVAATLVLLAVAGVITYAATGYFNDQETQAVTAVSTIAVKIRGDYANNPAGYASLSNLVAVAAGDVPAGLVKGSSIVNPWGSAITIAPLTVNGAASDFAIDFGAMPIKACVRLLTTDGSLMGANVNGAQLTLPVGAAAATAACNKGATGGMATMTSQYGQSQVPVTPPTVSVQYLVVGGGGGGDAGRCAGWFGDGGGGGQVLSSSMTQQVGSSVEISVGAGGAAGGGIDCSGVQQGASSGGDGAASSLGSVSAAGGARRESLGNSRAGGR